MRLHFLSSGLSNPNRRTRPGTRRDGDGEGFMSTHDHIQSIYANSIALHNAELGMMVQTLLSVFRRLVLVRLFASSTMSFDVLLLLFLSSVAMGVEPPSVDVSKVNNSVVVNDYPLKLNVAAATSDVSIRLKLKTEQLQFTAIRPLPGCLKIEFQYLIGSCETELEWREESLFFAQRAVISTTAKRIRLNLTPTTVTAHFIEKGQHDTEVIKKFDKLCFLSAKKNGTEYDVDFSVKKWKSTSDCHEVLIEFADDVNVPPPPLPEPSFFARLPLYLIFPIVAVMLVIILLCLCYCYVRKVVFWHKKKAATESEDPRRRSMNGTKHTGGATPKMGSSLENEDPNLKSAHRAKPTPAKPNAAKQVSSTRTDGEKSNALSVPSQMWDVNKDVRAGPVNPDAKFDRMIDYVSKRPPIETLNFYCNTKIIMLREPGKKMYKWNIEIDNRSSAWASFIIRHGPQHVRQGEGADCITQGKHALVPFIRNLQPWRGWELVVFQMKQFPVRRWGGLPFPENVEYFHRFEHGTRDLFVYITEMMSEEDAATFYAARLEERRAMLLPEDRDSLPKTFQVLIATEATEADIQACLNKAD